MSEFVDDDFEDAVESDIIKNTLSNIVSAEREKSTVGKITHCT